MKLTCNVIRLRIIGIRPHGRQVNDKDRGEDESDQSDEEDGQKAFRCISLKADLFIFESN